MSHKSTFSGQKVFQTAGSIDHRLNQVEPSDLTEPEAVWVLLLLPNSDLSDLDILTGDTSGLSIARTDRSH